MFGYIFLDLFSSKNLNVDHSKCFWNSVLCSKNALFLCKSENWFFPSTFKKRPLKYDRLHWQAPKHDPNSEGLMSFSMKGNCSIHIVVNWLGLEHAGCPLFIKDNKRGKNWKLCKWRSHTLWTTWLGKYCIFRILESLIESYFIVLSFFSLLWSWVWIKGSCWVAEAFQPAFYQENCKNENSFLKYKKMFMHQTRK